MSRFTGFQCIAFSCAPEYLRTFSLLPPRIYLVAPKELNLRAILIPLRHTLRRLARSPMFTAISLVTLAIGIGANTAIFSVIEGVLLKPLPYPRAGQLVALWHTAPGVNIKDLNMAPSLYFIYSDESRVFQDVSMWRDETSSITGLAEPEEVPVLSVTHRLLPILDVQPALGRRFTASDDDPKSERTVMLTDGYWKSRFGGDRSVLGRRIMVDGDAREIIGVLPPSFQFMDQKVSAADAPEIQSQRGAPGQFQLSGRGAPEARRDAPASQRRYRAHAAHGDRKVSAALRISARRCSRMRASLRICAS